MPRRDIFTQVHTMFATDRRMDKRTDIMRWDSSHYA